MSVYIPGQMSAPQKRHTFLLNEYNSTTESVMYFVSKSIYGSFLERGWDNPVGFVPYMKGGGRLLNLLL